MKNKALTINIGTEINIEELLQSRLLIQANSGGGKSVLARTLIEESCGKVPFIIMDIEGEYYTLKEKFGDILVIGGQHADVPINIKSAKLLPKEIISNRVSVVIDLSDLQMSDRILYAKYFIEALMELGQQYWVNYLVFIEEAHKLCGEQDKQVSATAIKDLMSRGRKRGFCGVLITQRISKLHKDAAAECNNKFIGRTYLDIDLKRAGSELGLTTRDEMNAIRDLKPGNFYAFGTSIIPHEVHVVKIKLPQTKIPKAGMNIDIKAKKPTEKVMAILSKLTVLPTEVKKDGKITFSGVSNSIPVFNGNIKTYEKEWREALDVNSGLVAQIKRIEHNQKIKDKNIENAIKLLSSDNNKIDIPSVLPLKMIPGRSKGKIELKTIPTNKTPVNTAHSLDHYNTKLGKCPMAIVECLGSYPDKSFSKAQIGVLSGYSPNSGGFNNALAELNTKGLIIKEGSKIKAGDISTVLGWGFVPKEYSIDTYKSKLSKCEREIYEVLLENPELSYGKEQLADATPSKYSHNSGGFNNALSSLNTLELIERSGGQIKLNPELLELI